MCVDGVEPRPFARGSESRWTKKSLPQLIFWRKSEHRKLRLPPHPQRRLNLNRRRSSPSRQLRLRRLRLRRLRLRHRHPPRRSPRLLQPNRVRPRTFLRRFGQRVPGAHPQQLLPLRPQPPLLHPLQSRVPRLWLQSLPRVLRVLQFRTCSRLFEKARLVRWQRPPRLPLVPPSRLWQRLRCQRSPFLQSLSPLPPRRLQHRNVEAWRALCLSRA